MEIYEDYLKNDFRCYLYNCGIILKFFAEKYLIFCKKIYILMN